MNHFLYSLESVGPLVVLVLIGYILRRKEISGKAFIDTGTSLVFKLSLPVLLFNQISKADLKTVFDPYLILFAMISTLTVIGLLFWLVPRFLKTNPERGAFIQAVYRGNFSILGVPLAISMFTEAGAAPTALLLPFTIPLYNIAAVIILTAFDDTKKDSRNRLAFWPVIKDILKNPLIIGIILGLPFSLLNITLPKVIDQTLTSIASLTTPLALICLGGQFTIQSVKEKLKPALWATALKLVIIPSVMIGIAILLGFHGGQLGAVFILFMAPSAVSSYIMAKNMHSDEMLAGQILLFTTVFSSFTIFIGIFLLHFLGLI